MVKVLHCVSRMDRAGQETFIMNVYRKIDRKVMQFNFLCSDDSEGEYDKEILSMGGKIFFLGNIKQNHGLSKYFSRINLIKNWFQENKRQFDIIHVHTYHALDVFVHLEAARQAKINNIIIHSHNTNGPHICLHKVLRIINNRYKCTRLACAEDAALWLYGKRIVNLNKVLVVYNGIEVEKYKYDFNTRNEIKRELGIDDKIVIGHIGRFNYQKNHDFIVKVYKEYLKENQNSVLLFVGKGERFNEIQDLVEKEGIKENVLFLGSRDDVPKLLSVIDVLLFPSLFEGLSVVLVEAQAAGLPCVVSDNILPDEERIIPDLFMEVNLNSNISQWVDAIQKMFNKHGERLYPNELMKNSNFNIHNTVLLMEELYFNLAEARVVKNER